MNPGPLALSPCPNIRLPAFLAVLGGSLTLTRLPPPPQNNVNVFVVTGQGRRGWQKPKDQKVSGF